MRLSVHSYTHTIFVESFRRLVGIGLQRSVRRKSSLLMCWPNFSSKSEVGRTGAFSSAEIYFRWDRIAHLQWAGRYLTYRARAVDGDARTKRSLFTLGIFLGSGPCPVIPCSFYQLLPGFTGRCLCSDQVPIAAGRAGMLPLIFCCAPKTRPTCVNNVAGAIHTCEGSRLNFLLVSWIIHRLSRFG